MSENKLPAGNPPVKAPRNASLDLLRIVSMFLIVTNHVLSMSDVWDTLNATNTINEFSSKTVMAIALVAVNCLILITGYFQSQNSFKLEKLLKLWVQVLFWSILLYMLSIALGCSQWNIKEIAKNCLPITQQRYWFFTVYVLLYVLSPFLNIAINAMNRRQHLFCILVCLFWFTVLQNIIIWREFTATNGNHVVNFAILYFTGAYIRKYPPPQKIMFGRSGICYVH